METKHTTVATIGYEAADLTDFIATLRQAGVTRLIDIRELPISRRKGFAKRALSKFLAAAGIDYVHLRGLGDPREGREAARAGDIARFTRVFTSHMKSETSQADLRRAVHLVAHGGACLMCYERDHSACHRSIVATAISNAGQAAIHHLEVREGLGRNYESSDHLGLVAHPRA